MALQLLALHKPSGEYANALALAEIWLVMAIASAEPERGFSLMNRIKCDWCSTLDVESLNDLMTIEMSNKDLSSFNPTRSVSLWWQFSMAWRRLVNPHGPHKIKNKQKATLIVKLNLMTMQNTDSFSSVD